MNSIQSMFLLTTPYHGMFIFIYPFLKLFTENGESLKEAIRVLVDFARLLIKVDILITSVIFSLFIISPVL